MRLSMCKGLSSSPSTRNYRQTHVSFYKSTWITGFFRKHRLCLGGAACSARPGEGGVGWGVLQQPGGLPILQVYMASSGSLPSPTLPFCPR